MSSEGQQPHFPGQKFSIIVPAGTLAATPQAFVQVGVASTRLAQDRRNLAVHAQTLQHSVDIVDAGDLDSDPAQLLGPRRELGQRVKVGRDGRHARGRVEEAPRHRLAAAAPVALPVEPKSTKPANRNRCDASLFSSNTKDT